MADLQYYPSKLLADGINFYEKALNSFKNGENWFLFQYPNYYYSLYFLLAPFTFFGYQSFKILWFSINIFMLYKSVFFINELPNMNWKQTLIVFLPLIFGFPLSNVLGGGQFGVVILFSILYFLKKEVLLSKTTMQIIIFSKYTFGLTFILDLFLNKKFKLISYVLLILAIFPIVFSITFNVSLFRVLEYPLQINSMSTPKGPFDLMSISLDFFNEKLSLTYLGSASLILGTYVFLYSKIKKEKYQILFFPIILSFLIFFHGPYDYMLFILPLVYLKIKSSPFFNFYYIIFLIFGIAPRFLKYFLNFENERIYNLIFFENSGLRIFGFILLFTLLLLQFRVERQKPSI